MARKERNSADYFPHIIGSGKKMFVIERKFGNDGYATWFKILESLTIAEYHFLDLSEESQVLYLAAKCNVDEDLLFKIIEELVKLGSINAFLWQKKIIWSDYYIENIADAYARRNNKCIRFEQLCIRFGINCIHYDATKGGIVYINPHTKVKYTILNNTKEDYSSSLKNDGDSNPKENTDIFPSFNDFWNMYDKKVDKTKCERKWKNIPQKEKEQIIENVPKYVQATPDIQFRKNPLTYLNSKTYLDEVIIPQSNGAKHEIEQPKGKSFTLINSIPK